MGTYVYMYLPRGARGFPFGNETLVGVGGQTPTLVPGLLGGELDSQSHRTRGCSYCTSLALAQGLNVTRTFILKLLLAPPCSERLFGFYTT